MPLLIENDNPALLNAAHDAAGGVYVLYENQAMPSTEPHVQIDLTEPGQDGDYHTQIKIADFVENSVTKNVYAHRVASGGSLSPWSRVSGAVQSPAYSYEVPLDTAAEEFDLMCLAVAEGSSGPTYTTQTAAEQAGASRIRVKIIKNGSRPSRKLQRR